MSETISEMILPGTYIDVRAEGLISVGGISTGNIGVVGTANKGPVGEAILLGSYADAVDTFGFQDAFDPDGAPPSLTLTRTLEQVFRGGGSTIYAVRVANATVAAATWEIDGSGDNRLFNLRAKSPGTWANDIEISVSAPATEPQVLELELGRIKESFAGINAGEVFAAVNEGSQLVEAFDPDAARTGNRLVAAASVGTTTAGGPDGASATTVQLSEGLAALANEPVNIITAGGFDAATAIGDVLVHIEATENDGNERIAVLGASSDDPGTVVSADAASTSSGRVVLVAPGLVAADSGQAGAPQVDLTAPYAAALVAGRIATLAPHVSLTNKTVQTSGLSRVYTRTEQKLLLQNRVMVLHRNLGFRALKGISTDTGAFKQISVRRIVDFAKAGVRQGSNPYIGKLNNSRVRAALKATLDAFLSNMVLDEMLTGYSLDVSATRRQEIEGVAVVTMELQPTFSIDFVKVIMNLS